MSIEVFSNNATTTLGSAAAPSDTTMTLAVGTGALFPSPSAGQYFTATLWAAGSTTGVPNEIVHVTAISGDTVTVVRGQEGTTAQSWSVGDTFANYITANFLNNILTTVDLQSQSGNSAVDTGTANAGVITLSPAITSLAQLLYSPIRVYKINSPNTGAYTLNINGQGAKSVTLGGVALAAAQLLGHQVFEVFWDGTNLELLSVPAVIENVGLALMAADTIKGNNTGSPASPIDLSVSQVKTLLSFPGIASSAEYLAGTNNTDIITPLTFATGLGGTVNALYWPNGLLLQNQYVAYSTNTDTTVPVTLPVSYIDANWLCVNLATVISVADSTKDLMVQFIQGSKSSSGFSVYYQHLQSTSGTVDGFYWSTLGFIR